MKRFDGYMKGINLGGWLSQHELTEEHMNTFITKKDIEIIKGRGADHIRLPIDYSVFENEDGSDKPDGFKHIDDCVEWCGEYGLNLVLDLHKTYGYIFDVAEECRNFFYDEAKQERFLNIWDKLASRYAKYSDRMAFEPLNEVVDVEVKDIWNELAEKAIKVIRKYAPTSYILIGGTRNNAIVSVKELKAPYDDHVVYNFHCYEPLIFTHQAAYWVPGMPADFRISYPKTMGEYADVTQQVIGGERNLIDGYENMMCSKEFFMDYFKEAVSIAEKQGTTLYCGEYGVIDKASDEDANRWFDDIHAAFEELGIGRALWSYKEMDFGRA
ncbi:MAG: glycoside hydrolase family 5 protein [Lachnospiraceae bacterium]|nr:glycoside hydrolase family 5 protein [Lachnospiraceae bacterium]